MAEKQTNQINAEARIEAFKAKAQGKSLRNEDKTAS
jgi:hypothetical protein